MESGVINLVIKFHFKICLLKPAICYFHTMRTLELLGIFGDKELKELDQTIAGKKKQSLKRLYHALIKLKDKSQEPDNKKLYEVTFGAKYAAAKDYVLRNELRLLNEIIYGHIINASFNQYINQFPAAYNKWLLKGLFDRKLTSLFGSDIDSSIEQSKKSVKPDETAEMLSFKSLWLLENQARTSENLKQHLQLFGDMKRAEEKRFLYRVREMEARQAFIQLLLDYVQSKQDRSRNDERTAGANGF